MSDVAVPQSADICRHCLQVKLQPCFVSLHPWPVYSPDLNRLSWDLKERVYRNPILQNLDQLKANRRWEVQEISQERVGCCDKESAFQYTAQRRQTRPQDFQHFTLNYYDKCS